MHICAWRHFVCVPNLNERCINIYKSIYKNDTYMKSIIWIYTYKIYIYIIYTYIIPFHATPFPFSTKKENPPLTSFPGPCLLLPGMGLRCSEVPPASQWSCRRPPQENSGFHHGNLISPSWSLKKNKCTQKMKQKRENHQDFRWKHPHTTKLWFL